MYIRRRIKYNLVSIKPYFTLNESVELSVQKYKIYDINVNGAIVYKTFLMPVYIVINIERILSC